MDLHTKAMMLGVIRQSCIEAEEEFAKKLEELENQKHLEFERFKKKVSELVKDIPEEDFGKFATACLGTMSDNLNAMMIASYVSEHENMSQTRKNEFLLMAMVLSGELDANEVGKALFPDDKSFR